jgi:hypothetical protein
MLEKTNVSFAEASRENSPSMPVLAPLVVPLMTTPAPMTGRPASSTTTPFIFFFAGVAFA